MRKTFHPVFSDLLDHNLEHQYIVSYSKSLNTMIFFSVFVFLLNIIALLISDFFITGNAFLEVNFIVYLRIIVAIYMVTILILIQKKSDFHFIEYNVLILFILMATANFVGHLTFPNPGRNVYTLEIIVTMMMYLVFPINIRFQLIGGILFSLSNFVSLDPNIQSEKIFYHTSVMLFNANIIGFFISRFYQRTMRKLFISYQQESDIQEEYLRKVTELQTISSVVPICNTCYSVRNDQGYWDNLEHFISSHSHSHFTHSICPDCTQKMLKELDDSDL